MSSLGHKKLLPSGDGGKGLTELNSRLTQKMSFLPLSSSSSVVKTFIYFRKEARGSSKGIIFHFSKLLNNKYKHTLEE